MNLRESIAAVSGSFLRRASGPAGLAGLLLVAGCHLPAETAGTAVKIAPTAPAPDAVLIHLPGIAGEMPIDHNLLRGLLRGGVAPVGCIIDWTGQDRGVPALTNVARHTAWAKHVADTITRIVRHDSRTPIVLVAHSAGTGIAVQALEQLPPDVHVRTLVLLASALSPDYDLTRALAHVDGHAFSIYSPYDNLVLGTGTRTFGTYDRVRTDAAGYVGFRVPQAESTPYGLKFRQMKYDPAWQRYGNGGDHIGVTSAPFARAVLAPLINDDAKPATTQP